MSIKKLYDGTCSGTRFYTVRPNNGGGALNLLFFFPLQLLRGQRYKSSKKEKKGYADG